jgi:ribose-phosphate pyrophosphokinase
MMLFSVPELAYLADKIDLQKGACTIKHFSDGELFVRIDEPVQGKDVWVLAATNPPGDNLITVLLLLDALQRSGARINLLLTYFGYARQDRTQKGESLAGKVMADILALFAIERIKVIHMHSARMRDYLDFDNCIPLDLFAIPAGDADVVVAPDKGAHELARLVSKAAGIEAVYITKKRPHQEEVEIVEIDGNVQGKRVLVVDDMITTGNTVIQAAQALLENGATSVSVCATHGVFSPGAYQALAQSPITQVYVTNTLPQKEEGAIIVLDSASYIHTLLD